MSYKNFIRGSVVAITAGAACLCALSDYLPGRSEPIKRIYVTDVEGGDYKTGKPGLIVADNPELTVFRRNVIERNINGNIYENAEEQKRKELEYTAKVEANGAKIVNQWAETEAEKNKQDFSGLKERLKKLRKQALESRAIE